MEGRIEFRDGALKDALHEIGQRAAELTPLMDMIGSQLVSSAQSRIGGSNIGPDGVPWPPSLRAREDGGRTLYDTGRLRESIVSAASAREVEVGSNLPYAGIHQFGGEIVPKVAGALSFRLANGQFVTCGKVTIPARPYLGISDEDQAQLTDVALAYLAGDDVA